ncbi:MAG: hypothetical protein AAB403_15535, partial [Planctomycetota bacterium]
RGSALPDYSGSSPGNVPPSSALPSSISPSDMSPAQPAGRPEMSSSASPGTGPYGQPVPGGMY